ncbi:J domain-containing protein required for chloroplast accumulation response 1 isoform X2 [Cynara cardunculus var. scolymus]|uniref:J domain-containing protein required for chloroplast accumulation response 1 isoform X2 n=1 Tax=Cynara cardunculus var. scolymus TaxID=59895 RepID=UPI000D6260EE|nr:J domain-containing protein required for chloroplast accumulation response 1 isoform X2 [Cynara cardunculus var. scolymus]
MEKLGRTANVSLQYGLSQRSFENEASSSAMELKPSDNDVDFDDVFGGPPTRTRYSFGGGRIKSEESTSSSIGLGERPVFGESYSSPRRPTSDDFYDDIFRRSDESVRSPSLPAKMTKAIDIPILGSSSSSPHRYKDGASNVHSSLNVSLSRFSSPAMQGRDLFQNNPGQSPGQTLLSRESSGVKESLYSTLSTENGIDHKSKHTTARAGSPSSEFHFSIHKWANIGVPLLMSLRGGKQPTMKGSSKVSAVSMDSTPDAGFPVEVTSADKEDMNPLSGNGLAELTEKEISMVKQEVNEQEVIPPHSPLRNEIKGQGGKEAGREAEGKETKETMSGVLHSDVDTTSKKKLEAKKMNSSKKAEPIKPAVGSPKSSGESFGKSRVKGMVKDFFKMSNQENPPKTKANAVGRSLSSRWKTTAKNRTELDSEVAEIISNLDVRVPAADVETMPDASNTTELNSEVPAENVKTAREASRTTPLDRKVSAGNVKTATEAFRTTPLDRKVPVYVKTATEASRTTPLDRKVPVEYVKTATEASSTTPLDRKVPVDNVNMMPDASFMVQGHGEKSNKKKFARNRTIKKLEDIYFQMDASPASESVPYGSKVTVENIDDPSLDNFQVEELSLVEDKLSETQEESEAIRALDSKIHLWSNGRKGNIRSLLSTLQLVLWPESGWKPVALVDIIEANAVKKSYNRAMLCLHPDKLQQKGADSHKKYTAEKVFDILQEAWDHFSSLGTLV